LIVLQRDSPRKLCAGGLEEERRSHLIIQGDLSSQGKVRPYYRFYLFTLSMQCLDFALILKLFSIQLISMTLLQDFPLLQFSLHYPPAQLEEAILPLYHCPLLTALGDPAA
jgi:hypothetical protein